MSRWLWPELQSVLDGHAYQLDLIGGMPGIKDINTIEAALARPQQRAYYEKPDAAELAAAYAFGLAKGHGFHDGNKRIGWITARLFLRDNGFSLQVEKEEAIEAMLKLAAGEMSEEGFAGWIRERIEVSPKHAKLAPKP